MSSTDSGNVTIRPAQQADCAALAPFIHAFVEQQKLLPRTETEVTELVEHGFVAECEGRIVGFSALEIYSPKMAEIRSLAVDASMQGRGLGKKLVNACVELARSEEILEVMAITSSDEFFQSCGFDFTLPGEKKALFIHTRDD